MEAEWRSVRAESTEKPEKKFSSKTEAPVLKQQKITMLGIIPVISPPPEQLRQYIQTEIARWGKLVRQAGIFGSE